jgi:RND family efflux transporter MFP subunit
MMLMHNSRIGLYGGILVALLTGCGPGDATVMSASGKPTLAGKPADSSDARVKVMPIRPVRKTLVRWTELPGQIEAFEETPLYAKLAGYVEKMHVDIGDLIKGPQFDEQGMTTVEGQVLAELSIPELDEELQQKDAAIGQAKAELSQASAAIKVAKASEASARAKVEESESAVELTQADYDFAASEFARLKKLADRGSVTQEVAEEKQKLLRIADSARKQTQARIASARATVTEKRALIEKADADLEAAKQRLIAADADLARVKALQSYTKIRGPYDGVVTARNVHTGHLVQPGAGSGGKPLLVVVQIRVMRIFLNVPETDASLIADGAVAEVKIPSNPAKPRQGTVTRTAWILNSGSRTLRIEVDLDNVDGKLRPGMYADVRLKVAERPNALALPEGTVLTADGKTYCYTITMTDESEGEVVRTPIETGIRAGDDIEIVSGLTGDEQIIVVNAAAFREGQKVQVEPAKQ